MDRLRHNLLLVSSHLLSLIFHAQAKMFGNSGEGFKAYAIGRREGAQTLVAWATLSGPDSPSRELRPRATAPCKVGSQPHAIAQMAFSALDTFAWLLI